MSIGVRRQHPKQQVADCPCPARKPQDDEGEPDHDRIDAQALGDAAGYPCDHSIGPAPVEEGLLGHGLPGNVHRSMLSRATCARYRGSP